MPLRRARALGYQPPRLLDGLGPLLHGDIGRDLGGDPLILVQRLQLVTGPERLAVLLLCQQDASLELQGGHGAGLQLDRLVEHGQRLVRGTLFLVVLRQGEEGLRRPGLHRFLQVAQGLVPPAAEIA